jgi:DNA-binding PadR family transcriptional regulator
MPTIALMQTKDLIKGALNTIILNLLKEHGQMYGYEITQEVKRRTNGKILIREGSLYPALHKLLAEEMVMTEEVLIGRRTRIYYKLTSKGQEQTVEQTTELIGFLDTVASLIFPDKKLAHG